ncbi:TerC family protein [Gottfriedia endophytica]|uniref:TerC family protein n=1 Tax=Gottfriedia endophytica TaxID=2820819 RepID=UPI001FD77471|nr:TerC family protein [Gottfriedia endophytica]
MDIFGMSVGVLLQVILVDILLSGDNAVLIALAAKNLEGSQRKKAVAYGTVGAVALRLVFAFVIVYLLKIPFIHAIGGILLLKIALDLIVQNSEDGHVKSSTTLWGAVKTIVLADALMSLDNVVALAGIAHGFLPILCGVMISIPLIVWGSTYIMKLMDKFPVITTIGAALLAWTAASMIVHDEMIGFIFSSKMISYIFQIVVTIGLVVVGQVISKKQAKVQENIEVESQRQSV